MTGRFRCPECNEWEGPTHPPSCPSSAAYAKEHGEIMCAWNKCEVSEKPRNMDECGWAWVDKSVGTEAFTELAATLHCGFLCPEHTREFLRGLYHDDGPPWCEGCDRSGWIAVNAQSVKCPECRGLGATLRGVEYEENESDPGRAAKSMPPRHEVSGDPQSPSAPVKALRTEEESK